MDNNTAIALTENAMTDTSHLSIIKIEGDDAQSFLQGQFSNDVALLVNLGTQLNSYNSPKGRMYAAFRLCQFDSKFYMVLPNDVVEQVLKRLKMFVMRSNVTLENISEQWKTLGLSGNELNQTLEKLNIALPEDKGQSIQCGNKFLINLTVETPRALFIGPEQDILDVKSSLKDEISIAQPEHWKRLDIEAGIPNVYAATQESFVAQMVNFQLIDGVSFTKGCYPGQEVVARMHYLGKLKKRMYRVSLNAPASPDDKIFDSSSDNQQSVGQIVDAQLNENNSYDALAVIQVNAAEANALKLSSTDGEAINVETLPYAFGEE